MEASGEARCTRYSYFFNFWIFILLLAVRPSLHYNSTTTIRMDNDDLGLLKSLYRRLQDFRNKRLFFQECRRSGVIPDGVSLQFNLALGVNEPVLVTRIESILEKASSEIMDTLEDFCVENEADLETKYDDAKENFPEQREITKMKREVNAERRGNLDRMKNKIRNLKKRLVFPKNFVRCLGSRRIRAQLRGLPVGPQWWWGEVLLMCVD